MLIRPAQETDWEALSALFASARAFMRQCGNPHQWGDDYPDREIILKDIQRGTGYVCTEDGEILAYFALPVGPDPTYAYIDGAWLNDRPYGTLHRVASSGKVRGMADVIIRWGFERTGNLRGDTHALNLPMQRAFERNGFVYCGTIWVEDATPRKAYQKQA